MWIRSQTKTRLVEVKNAICIYFNNEKTVEVNGHIVGEYESKERAMKVLDEIQNAIFYDYNVGNKPVFEMPKD